MLRLLFAALPLSGRWALGLSCSALLAFRPTQASVRALALDAAAFPSARFLAWAVALKPRARAWLEPAVWARAASEGGADGVRHVGVLLQATEWTRQLGRLKGDKARSARQACYEAALRSAARCGQHAESEIAWLEAQAPHGLHPKEHLELIKLLGYLEGGKVPLAFSSASIVAHSL